MINLDAIEPGAGPYVSKHRLQLHTNTPPLALIHKGSYTFATILMEGDSTFISYVFGMTNILDLYQYKNLNPTVNPNNHFQIRLPLYSFDKI